jgi:integrase/recombinase XerD
MAINAVQICLRTAFALVPTKVLIFRLCLSAARPLASHIGLFARSLSEQGYTLNSIHRQVLLAACFSRWLKQQVVPLSSITSDHPPLYLRYRARQVQPSLGDAAALGHLLDFLRSEGMIPAEKTSACPLTSAERCTQAYEHHLREARGLASATIANYAPFILSFLADRFGDGPVTLSHLCARDVVRFVQRQAPRLHPKRAKYSPIGTLRPSTPQICSDCFANFCRQR